MANKIQVLSIIMDIAVNGGVEADVRHRVNEGYKVLGALKGVIHGNFSQTREHAHLL